MPTRKIPVDERWIKPHCRHPEHNPPSHMVFEPGFYEHECPACHHITRFRVERAVLGKHEWNDRPRPWCAEGCCADLTRGGTL